MKLEDLPRYCPNGSKEYNGYLMDAADVVALDAHHKQVSSILKKCVDDLNEQNKDLIEQNSAYKQHEAELIAEIKGLIAGIRLIVSGAKENSFTPAVLAMLASKEAKHKLE